MKNKLPDLHNHLFAELERLSDESLKGDKLTEEIGRAKAITAVAKEIINNSKLILDAQKTIKEWCMKKEDLPQLFDPSRKNE